MYSETLLSKEKQEKKLMLRDYSLFYFFSLLFYVEKKETGNVHSETFFCDFFFVINEKQEKCMNMYT